MLNVIQGVVSSGRLRGSAVVLPLSGSLARFGCGGLHFASAADILFMMTLHSNKRGAVLLVVLAAVAIVMLLYMVNIRAIFGPSLRTPPRGIEERPWLLEDLLVAEGQPIRLPKAPKPTLNVPLTLAGPVSRNDAPRGTVQITLGDDGRVRADWQAEYAHPPKQYHLTAEVSGNIDIQQTFTGADGRDKSRLFFIAKGPYRLLTEDPETGRSEETGAAWLLGYLSPDGRAEGALTLTIDRQWAVVYQYTAILQKEGK